MDFTKKGENMKSFTFRKNVLPVLVVVLGGLFSIILVYAIYLGVYLGIEALFYPDPTQTPTDFLRAGTSLVLCVGWFLFSKIKMPDTIKAALGVGPLTMLMVVIFFRIYFVPVWALVATFGLGLVIAALIYFFKKPWFYYLIPIVAFIVCAIYAWPRPY